MKYNCVWMTARGKKKKIRMIYKQSTETQDFRCTAGHVGFVVCQ